MLFKDRREESMEPMRIVFMGTPDFAATILRAVNDWDGGKVVAAYTQPDRPAGRGKQLKRSAVKAAAEELGIPVFQPVNFKDEADVEALSALRPDVLAVAAYGLLLPQKVLDIPKYFPLNVHGSLLPQYRGAAPIQRAVMNGDTVTGVTIMKMEAGLDTGPMLLQQAVRIEPDDTAGSMFEILARHGADLMLGALRMVAEGRAAFVPQNDALAGYAHKIGREEEMIDWKLPASRIHNIIRGLSPDPGARTFLHMEGREPLGMRIGPGEALDLDTGFAPGTLVRMEGGALIAACGSGSYKITALRPAGKNTMGAADFYNGRLKGLAAPYGVLAPQG